MSIPDLMLLDNLNRIEFDDGAIARLHAIVSSQD
jgi:hypothetical protein